MRYLTLSILAVLFIGGTAYAQCATFDSAENGQDALANHSLYREYYKQKNYDEAYPLWLQAYTVAPAANGKTTKHFTNGITIYSHMMDKETDEAKKAEYFQKILDLYTHHMECFPKDKGKVMGNMAVKKYYNTPVEERMAVYDDAQACIAAQGNGTRYNVLYPLACSAVTLYLNEEITADDARNVHETLNQIADYNIANAKKDTDKQRYEAAKAQLNTRFKAIATDIFDCQYFKDEHLSAYEANPDDYETIKAVRAKLIQGGCEETDAIVLEMENKMKAHIATVNAANAEARWEALPNANKGAKFLKEGDYEQAITHYNLAIEEADDPTKKGDYHYAIAQAYFKMKKYSNARTNARQAAKYKPNWGKPYMLIGSLYASSTRSCGDAFEGRMVVLAAIEKYAYAKNIDASVAEDANKKIARLASSKPTREDCFQRGLKDGSSYKVGCWIGETVTVKTVKGY
ncbi:MAG: hypothetical protein AAF502_02725 [Bacteroidota bacterium]